MTNLSEINEKIQEASSWVSLLKTEMARVIVGQQYLVDRLIVAILANGHILLEGVPGLAKTLSIRTLAQAIDGHFQRIQFTPDLLPADIVGTLMYNPQTASFYTKKGPIFANLVLADEINRAPAKVQSALLEAMQERQVTLGNETYDLPSPFLVMATQNPIDQEGTYALPEAQVDRFLLKAKIDYPSKEEELLILESRAKANPISKVNAVIKPDQILAARTLLESIYMDPKIKDYIVNIVLATRKPSAFGLDMDALVAFGASPRATIALALASKAWAFIKGRGYVTPQDIKTIGLDVLRHRVIASFEAQAEDITNEALVQKIFDAVPVP
ncbi:MAG: ATPase [Verrucomicrobia bacterium GWF2_51_19]|nr:MAG: ATPase [Verrucomicrobia bacterium GWF2_51_19]HCJ11561.1 ATPase [Opitutae bacterium]